MKKSKIAFNDIDRAATYEGYLWLSDKQTPDILCGQKIDNFFFGLTNPFIIEGQLYDAVNKRSYSIRYADGEVIVTRFVLDDADFRAEENDVKTYLPNHMEGISSLRFLDVWEAESAPLCCNLKVLQPRALVFVGFNKKQDDHAKE